ncbi:MAG TPA: hypothetical protein DD979_07935 [Gammaproteobacteria bacterium]|jgi:thioredoxin-related protein|nr:hypothetical protein [Gammaproteobacteria bacterium]
MRLLLLLMGLMCAQVQASDGLNRHDLSELADAAKREQVPILLIVSQHVCPFCERLREEIIHPMRLSGEYEGKVLMAEIFMDSSKEIVDFAGHEVLPGVLADTYRVWVTPTLLFLDHTGRELHKRMLGVNTIEMYGYYLDESLAAALQTLQRGDRSYTPTERDIVGDAPGFDDL